MSIEFKKTAEFPRGLIYDLLKDAYSFDSRNEQCWKENWRQADDFLFTNEKIAEKCSFVTALNGEPIGFIVWDPRNIPAFAEIGHNCIRTKYKGNGYGKMQLQEAIHRICQAQTKKIIVTTNSGLVSAQKNYESVGFKLIQSRVNPYNPETVGEHMDYELIIEA